MKETKKIKKILLVEFFYDPSDLLGQRTKSEKNKRILKSSRKIDNMDLL